MSNDHLACAGPRRALYAISVLVLSCGLSACDPPWAAEPASKTDASPISAEANIPPQDSTRAFTQSAPAAIAIGKGEAVPEADENPPIASEVELTPMENAGNPDGNAELAVRYDNAEALGDGVEFVIDKREYLLKRDEKDPKRFAAMIDFDFDLFQEEQESRRRQIAEAKASTFPVFEGRELVREEKFEFIDPEFVRAARERSLPIAIRPSTIALPPPPPGLDPSKTLMITDLSVVQDPERTFDICGNVGNPDGAWTFKTLMTNMANQSATSMDPADFVENWLQTWNVPHTINTFPVPARTNINARVLNPWPRIGGKLDLDRAPMRLLAIVNRVDLRNSAARSFGYGGSSEIPVDAGEGRFVFGVVDRNVNGGCSKMEFTVILEYKVPINQCSAIRSYAQQWSALGNITLGSAAFNPALQAITDQFTLAGVGGPTKPNGSAINQIRTNEIALVGYSGLPADLDPASLELRKQISASAISIPRGGPWELREFKLRLGDNDLHIVSTQRTPHRTLNSTALLANYINANTTSILNGTNVFPVIWATQPFLTGSTINSSVADSTVWNAPAIVDSNARHKFSLNTCNACHGGETRYNGKPVVGFPSGSTHETDFVHITPRDFNVQSNLSKFLTGTGTLAAPSTFLKGDPIMPAPGYTVRAFGDVLRRQNDLAGLSVQSCRSTAILQEALFRSLTAVH